MPVNFANVGGQQYFAGSAKPPKDHIYNPRTGNWVKRSGTIGRQIADAQRRTTEAARVEKRRAAVEEARQRDYQRREVIRKKKLEEEAQARKKREVKLEKRRLEIELGKKRRAENERKSREHEAKVKQTKKAAEEQEELDQALEEESMGRGLDHFSDFFGARVGRTSFTKEVAQLEKAKTAAEKRINNETTQEEYESEIEEINNEDIQIARENIEQAEIQIEKQANIKETKQLLEDTIWKADVLQPVMNSVLGTEVEAEPALNLREVAEVAQEAAIGVAAVTGMILAEQSIANSLTTAIAAGIKAGGGEAPDVPAVAAMFQNAYHGIPEVPASFSAVAVALSPYFNWSVVSNLAKGIGGVGAVVGVIWGLWHAIDWAASTAQVQEQILELSHDQAKVITQWEEDTGLDFSGNC